MNRLQAAPRLVLWAGMIVVTAFVLSSSPAAGAGYTVPAVSKLTATLPASFLGPETHLLCLLRAETEGSDVSTRAICYQSYQPLEAPLSGFAPAYHQLTAGEFSQSTGVLTLHPQACTGWPDVFAVKLDLLIPLDKGGGQVGPGNYVMVVEDTTPPFTCVGGTPTFGPLTLTPLAQDHNEDGDGCTDFQELGDNQNSGGLRDPFNFWDFFDTPDPNATPQRDGVININDIFRVAARFATAGDPNIDPLSKPPKTGYHPAYDRGGEVGPNDWNLAPADGAIGINEIFWVAAQFGHLC